MSNVKGFRIKNGELIKYTGKVGDVVIPDGITTIKYGAFKDRDDITSITIPDSVTKIDPEAFYGCTGLTSVNIQNISAWCNIEFGDKFSNPLYYAHKLLINDSLLTELVIPDGVSSIKAYAFINCSEIKHICISESVNHIESKAFNGTAFFNEENNWENHVLYISNCLIKADDSLSGRYDVKEGSRLIADRAFSQCKNLVEVNIPDSVKHIGDFAFNYCKSIESLTIGNGVVNIGSYAFLQCEALKSIKIPDSVTEIGDNAFANCISLIDIELSDSITEIKNGGAFWNCSSLKKISIPKGVTSIGSSAFNKCKSLEKIDLPEGLKFIGYGAFWHCVSLKELNIPDSVDEIGEFAFSDCIALEYMHLPFKCKVNYNAFTMCHDITNLDFWCVIYLNQRSNDAFRESMKHVLKDSNGAFGIMVSLLPQKKAKTAYIKAAEFYNKNKARIDESLLLAFTEIAKENYPDALNLLK